MNFLVWLLAIPCLTTAGVILTTRQRWDTFAHRWLISGCLLTSALGLTGAALGWCPVDQEVLTTLWPSPADGEASDFPFHLRLTTPDALVIALVSGGLAAFLSLNRPSSPQRCLIATAWLVWTAFWLVDGLWLSLVLQSALLGIGLLLAGWPTESAAAPQSRHLWTTIVFGDAVLLLTVLLWTVEGGITSFSQVESTATLVAVLETMPALVASCGLLLVLGTLGRTLQFPFGLFCDAVPRLPAVSASTIGLLVLAGTSWKWLRVAAVWSGALPQTETLIVAGGACAGLLAAWFAICTRDPRARLAWLMAVSWSWTAPVLVGLDPDSAAVWPAGCQLLLAVGLAGGWLLSLYRPCDSAPVNVERDPVPDSVNGATWSFHGQGASWTWSTAGWDALRAPANRAEQAREASCLVEGGRWTLAMGCISLLAGPLLWSGSLPAPSALSNPSGITQTMGDDSGDRSSDAAATPLDSTSDRVPIPAPRWPLAMRWFTLFLAGVAVAQTVSAAEPLSSSPPARWGTLLWTGGLCLLGPWILSLWPWESGRIPSSPLGTELLIPVGAVLLGGILGGWWRAAGRGPAGLAPWERLGRQRLYLGTLIWLLISLPLRSLAQVLRLVNGVLWQSWWGQVGAVVPQWGVDAEVDLHRSESGFYALSITVGAAVVLITLVWLGQ